MSSKENVKVSKKSLIDTNKPYESVALLLFVILIAQQIIFLLISLYRFATGGALSFFSMAGQTTQGFFGRIIGIDNSSGFVVLLAFLALIGFYALIYFLVFQYCEKHNYAKWTWTLIVVFGPTIFFISPMYIYAAFVFRRYFFEFLNKMLEEFKTPKPVQKKVEQKEKA